MHTPAKPSATSLSCIALVGAVATPALACTGDPPVPPPSFWVQYHGFDPGKNAHEIWVGQEVSLFPPPGPVVCACGLNITPAVGGPPVGAGVSVKEAGVFIVNTATHEMTPVDSFAFGGNPTTTVGLEAASPGGTWFGLSSSVNPFVPPVLQPGFVFKLLFLVNVDANLGGFTVTGRLGAGLGDPNGSPNLEEFHFFSPLDQTIYLPSPGPTALLGLAGLSFCRRRRA